MEIGCQKFWVLKAHWFWGVFDLVDFFVWPYCVDMCGNVAWLENLAPMGDHFLGGGIYALSHLSVS